MPRTPRSLTPVPDPPEESAPATEPAPVPRRARRVRINQQPTEVKAEAQAPPRPRRTMQAAAMAQASAPATVPKRVRAPKAHRCPTCGGPIQAILPKVGPAPVPKPGGQKRMPPQPAAQKAAAPKANGHGGGPGRPKLSTQYRLTPGLEIGTITAPQKLAVLSSVKGRKTANVDQIIQDVSVGDIFPMKDRLRDYVVSTIYGLRKQGLLVQV